MSKSNMGQILKNLTKICFFAMIITKNTVLTYKFVLFMEKIKIVFNDPVSVELLHACFQRVSNSEKELYVIYDMYRDPDPCETGLRLALSIASSSENLVIICTAQDFGSFEERYPGVFDMLKYRKNVAFFQIPIGKDRILETYFGLIKGDATKKFNPYC